MTQSTVMPDPIGHPWIPAYARMTAKVGSDGGGAGMSAKARG